MAGLANSRHAPSWHRPTRNSTPSLLSPNLTVPPAPVGHVDNGHIPHPPYADDTPQRPPASAPHELARYKKIIRRLQWKLPFLAQGYRLAVDRVGADLAVVYEAELMFKLDFFEYYMLIERALVHLLGVFGVEIPRGYTTTTTTRPHADTHVKNKNAKGLAGSVWADGNGQRTHRYHANVLAALDQEENPLHGVLGTGEVRVQLGRAKDLRNRWKTAGDEHDHHHNHHHHAREGSPTKRHEGAMPEREWRTRKVAAPLDSYRLEHMLEVIFRGFDEALSIAEAYVKVGPLEWGAEPDADMLEVDWAAAEDDEDQWDFMVEAMDWEAV
ncbi:hypothetical protein N657DRAFT_564589 [Parathielavia appendiculata]|uniref:Uncharacterized protein n=1 Tax=Parathielavia appendiculata TaxID=2587402 RepID=A0AAN6U7R9_9PEZI|nr:hypothetical protein N657DRAFT_564589 [Parathielavia appendiculata]